MFAACSAFGWLSIRRRIASDENVSSARLKCSLSCTKPPLNGRPRPRPESTKRTGQHGLNVPAPRRDGPPIERDSFVPRRARTEHSILAHKESVPVRRAAREKQGHGNEKDFHGAR